MAEDYDRVSDDYARMRRPIGSEILLGVYESHIGDLSKKTLVDIGCGPGNYSIALARHFERVRGLDKSDQQVVNARSQAVKAGLEIDRVDFQAGDALALPFEDGQADAALLSLVIHHIAVTPDDRSNHRQVFKELARVLRPGGVAVLGVCTRSQVFDGAWYCRLIPRASEVSSLRHPDPDGLVLMAADEGLRAAGRFVPVDAVLQGPDYFRADGPLDQSWRNGDSVFSLLTPQEVDELEARVRAMDKEGVLDSFMRKHDEVRKSIGQVTFMVFVRSSREDGIA